MAHPARQSIYDAIASIRLIDPHTHINPHSPASSTLADLLGYHYYTELAHSAGMPKEEIEAEGMDPRELVGRLVANLEPIENTAQYRWLVEICRKFFGFDGDRIDRSNWEQVYDLATKQMGHAQWPQMVLDQSNVEAVFLTNDFDDDLDGFDTDTYIPCLRTDDLVFHLAKAKTRQRLAACSGTELDGTLESLRESLEQRFDHFTSSGARACAISLPPSFSPSRISDGRAAVALDHVLRHGDASDPAHQAALSQRVFWTLAELCDEFGLPFDLMIGVNRGVYPAGVYQGQDLYDSRVSLIQYADLFNAFPEVKFPISVLASVTNQELVSYAWIFPNVITNGHWWYSNTPSFIARDAAARLEAVPQTKQIAYYSDAYKLEFVWPKFDMYRGVLADILAEHFVGRCGWSEDRAIELGQQVLRANVDEIFPKLAGETELTYTDSQADTWVEDAEPSESDDEPIDPTDATSAALAAGAIGMVEVTDSPIDPNYESRDSDLDGIPTTFDEPGDTETVKIDDDEAIEFALDDDTSDDAEFADSPTESGTEDTVKFDEADIEAQESNDRDYPDDPLPQDDEINAVDVADVTLVDPVSDPTSPNPDAIELESESELLDVGDVLGDQPLDADQAGIAMLRGEESFSPDSETLQTHPDPETGEWTLPIPETDDSTADNEDESIDLIINDSEDELLATIDLEDEDQSKDLEVDFELIDDEDDEDSAS